MAVGDFTPKKLLQKALSATATETSISGEANKRKYLTGISLCNTGTAARKVSVYGWGGATSNEIMRIPVSPGGTELLTDLPFTIEYGDVFYFKQDSGTDINIAALGREEELA